MANAPGSSQAITVEDVSKKFPQATTAVLQGVSFAVQAGEFVTLVGESGCGKTTLLRLLAGLDTPSSGRILLGDAVVSRPMPQVGFVFQRPVLLPWRTVLENVLLPAELVGQPRSTARQRALHLLHLLGLQDFCGHRPAQLSGGMQQRVALARTLLLQPGILLLDEPFGALDAITRERLHLALLATWEREVQTVVFITHDITEAVFLADRVLLMSRQPGSIAHTFAVPLPRPRYLDMRFESRFTELCRSIHQAMDLTHQQSLEAASHAS